MNAMRSFWNACASELKWGLFVLVCVAFVLFWAVWAVRGIKQKIRSVRDPFDVFPE